MILVNNRNTTNPYINLAIEEYLVRNADCSNHNLLFLYVNEPSVVLGKNQSIYKEVNFNYLRDSSVKLCRRISGGGTVYQDEGNLCFAFIQQFAEHKVNNYRYFNQPIVDALSNIGVVAEMDVRNNIICQGKKISGNAQFTNRKNIISHGTLLVNSQLNLLRATLRPNNFEIETRAVSSVSSSVANITDLGSTLISATDLSRYLAQSLAKSTEVLTFSDDEWRTIVSAAESKFMSFEWVYGRTPLTVIKRPQATITVEDGIITKIETPLPLNNGALTGTRYTYQDVKTNLAKLNMPAGAIDALF